MAGVDLVRMKRTFEVPFAAVAFDCWGTYLVVIVEAFVAGLSLDKWNIAAAGSFYTFAAAWPVVICTAAVAGVSYFR